MAEFDYSPPPLTRAQQTKIFVDGEKFMVEEVRRHNGFIRQDKLKRLTAAHLKVSNSQMNIVLGYAQHSTKSLVLDYQTEYVYETGTDLDALRKAVQDDPWLGYPNHEWKLNGYKVDDEVADLLMVCDRDPKQASRLVKKLLEDLRARKFDS